MLRQGRVRTQQSLTIKIPAGVDTGTRIHLAGEGEVGLGGGPSGDLYVEVAVAAHPTFQRRGDDLHASVEIPMTAAALGASIPLETFDVRTPTKLDAAQEDLLRQLSQLRGEEAPSGRPAAVDHGFVGKLRDAFKPR